MTKGFEQIKSRFKLAEPQITKKQQKFILTRT